MVYLMKQANDLIRKDLETFTAIIGEKAKEHKYTVMMGTDPWGACRTDDIWVEACLVVF